MKPDIIANPLNCLICKNELAIAMSVPSMGFFSSTAILAEIGDYTDFKNPEKLAAGVDLFFSVAISRKGLCWVE